MNYVLKTSSRKQNSFFSGPVQVLGGVVVVLTCVHLFFPKALPTLFTALAKPFWGTTTPEEFRTLLAGQKMSTAQNNALQKENEELKALLGRTTLIHPILATILKKPPFTAYDTFIIDIGDDMQIKKGDIVYVLGSIPIGEIAEVVGNTSKVRLYSSSGETFTVLIGTANIETKAVGKGGGYFEASLPRDTKIVPGDPVRIPSLTDSFIATVEAIASDPSEPFSKVLFRQPVNMYEQRWVLVFKHENK